MVMYCNIMGEASLDGLLRCIGNQIAAIVGEGLSLSLSHPLSFPFGPLFWFMSVLFSVVALRCSSLCSLLPGVHDWSPEVKDSAVSYFYTFLCIWYHNILFSLTCTKCLWICLCNEFFLSHSMLLKQSCSCRSWLLIGHLGYRQL